jgi:alkyl sulfatase BDS1-like metallo-beta-lactamase superfamily hydrolase
MLTGQAGLRETLISDDLEVEGSTVALLRFFSLFDKPEGAFNVVTP